MSPVLAVLLFLYLLEATYMFVVTLAADEEEVREDPSILPIRMAWALFWPVHSARVIVWILKGDWDVRS